MLQDVIDFAFNVVLPSVSLLFLFYLLSLVVSVKGNAAAMEEDRSPSPTEPVDARVIRELRASAIPDPRTRIVSCSICRRRALFDARDPDGLDHTMRQCSCGTFLCSSITGDSGLSDCSRDHYGYGDHTAALESARDIARERSL